jgi:hypothetical protein
MKIFELEPFCTNCITCGFCCKDLPSVISREEMKRLSGYVEALPPDEKPEQPCFTQHVNNPDNYLLVFDAGGCLLLKDNKCLIHMRFGYEVKGNMCRVFPAKKILIPTGLIRSMYFACPAAIRNLEFPLTITQREAAVSAWLTAEDLYFQGTTSVSWDELTPVADALAGIISDTDITLSAAMFEGVELLRVVGNKLGKDNTQQPSRIIDRVLPFIRDGAARRKLVCTEESDAACLGFLLDIARQTKHIMENAVGARQDLYAAFIDKLEKKLCVGSDDAPSTDTVADYAAFVRDWRLERGIFFRRELRNYLLWKIYEMDSFVTYGILPGFYIICLSMALIRLFAFALTETTGGELDFESLIYPIQLVDKYFLLNKPVLYRLRMRAEYAVLESPKLYSAIL